MRSGLSTRKTGQASATAEFIITLMSHSVAEMILGSSSQPFHGSVSSVCFSRISRSELRASESIGFKRPLKTSGSWPNSLKAKRRVLRRQQRAQEPRRRTTAVRINGSQRFQFFHFDLPFRQEADEVEHELDGEPEGDHARSRCRASASSGCARPAARTTARARPPAPPGPRPSGTGKRSARRSAADGSWRFPPRGPRRSAGCATGRGCENPSGYRCPS